jgi:TPR repeat protein
MPKLIGLGAGAGATALTLALGLAFWPQIGNAPATGRSLVSQPIFVAATSPGKPRAGEQATTIASTQVAKDDALAKLAVALKSDSSAKVADTTGATRSMTLDSAFASGLRIAPAPTPVSEAARRLCAQGLMALAAGDITGARQYLERAAEAGDARALMVLGTSYDPVTLARMGALGIKGDAARARDYYAKALAAGMGAARERMAALDTP